jgi:hypothetical protein
MDTAERALPASGRSMLDVDAPDHIAVTVASARVGDGLLVRVQELAGRSGSARITHPHGEAGSAQRCTALEDPLEPIAIHGGAAELNVGPYEVVSLHLRPAEAAPSSGGDS